MSDIKFSHTSVLLYECIEALNIRDGYTYVAIEEVAVEYYTTTVTGNMVDGFTVTNTHTPETTEVSGNKTWNDADNQDGIRPDSITINLLANGKVVDTITVTAKNNWSFTFEDLDKYESGKEIVYSISEEAVDGYTATYDRFNVTNTHKPSKTEVSVNKVWNDADNQDGKRPASVTIKLLADGKDTGKTVLLNENNQWSASFADLDEYKAGILLALCSLHGLPSSGTTPKCTSEKCINLIILHLPNICSSIT